MKKMVIVVAVIVACCFGKTAMAAAEIQMDIRGHAENAKSYNTQTNLIYQDRISMTEYQDDFSGRTDLRGWYW